MSSSFSTRIVVPKDPSVPARISIADRWAFERERVLHFSRLRDAGKFMDLRLSCQNDEQLVQVHGPLARAWTSEIRLDETGICRLMSKEPRVLIDILAEFLYTGEVFFTSINQFETFHHLCLRVKLRLPEIAQGGLYLYPASVAGDLLGSAHLKVTPVGTHNFRYYTKLQGSDSGLTEERKQDKVRAGEDCVMIRDLPKLQEGTKPVDEKVLMPTTTTTTTTMTPPPKENLLKLISGCAGCIKSCMSPSVFREHLSLRHYRKRLERDFTLRNSSGEPCCSLCGFTGSSVSRHVGSKHKIVDQYVRGTPEEAFLLRELKRVKTKDE